MHMLGLEDEVDYTDQNPAYGRDPGTLGGERITHGPASQPVSPASSMPSSSYPSTGDESSGIGAVRPIRAGSRAEPGGGRGAEPGGSAAGSGGSVRRVVKPVPMAANAKPHVVRPSSFNQAQAVADAYKVNQPVIMDLQDTDRDLARRLIDFASGLCYGLGGQMERLDTQVYLLTPTNVTVSDEERRRLRDRGYDA